MYVCMQDLKDDENLESGRGIIVKIQALALSASTIFGCFCAGVGTRGTSTVTTSITSTIGADFDLAVCVGIVSCRNESFVVRQ
jgi:hypothetical protein